MILDKIYKTSKNYTSPVLVFASMVSLIETFAQNNLNSNNSTNIGVETS